MGKRDYNWGAIAARGYNTDKYLGVVGCRGKVPDSDTGNTTGMFRRAEFARDDLTSFQLVYGGFWVDESVATDDSGGEVAGVDRVITASIEYPAGTFTRVTFGGQVQCTILGGAAMVISDPIKLKIPRDAAFFVNTYQTGARLLVTDGKSTCVAIGDKGSVGVGTISDQTMTGFAQSDNTSYRCYGPTAIIATTRRQTTGVMGDSLCAGNLGSINTNAWTGFIAPTLAPLYGLINLSRGSERLTNIVAGSYSRRAQYLQFVSSVVLETGVNDLYNGGKTGVQTDALRQQVRALFPDVSNWIETTVTPKNLTTTDAYATLANMGVDANLTERAAFNNIVRGRVSQLYDIADALESARNSGRFKASPMTPGAVVGDGTHCIDAGYALARAAVNPGHIR